MKDWPTTPGRYWYKGTRYKNDEINLHMVQVWKIANGIAYVCDGQFMFKSEGGNGTFIKAEIPEEFQDK